MICEEYISSSLYICVDIFKLECSLVYKPVDVVVWARKSGRVILTQETVLKLEHQTKNRHHLKADKRADEARSSRTKKRRMKNNNQSSWSNQHELIVYKRAFQNNTTTTLGGTNNKIYIHVALQYTAFYICSQSQLPTANRKNVWINNTSNKYCIITTWCKLKNTQSKQVHSKWIKNVQIH